MNRAPSLKALEAAFPSDDPAKLELIRMVWLSAYRSEVRMIAEQSAPAVFQWVCHCYNPPATREIRRRVIDALLDTHGVEHLGIHRRTDEHVYYCNTGDPYDATLIFHGRNLRIGCWGDLVERNTVRTENIDE